MFTVISIVTTVLSAAESHLSRERQVRTSFDRKFACLSTETVHLACSEVELERQLDRGRSANLVERVQTAISPTGPQTVGQRLPRLAEQGTVSPASGKRLKSVKGAWKNACKAAGISNLRVYDLRHTFGTRAADCGIPLIAIRDVMGHNTIGTTQKYAHATDAGKRRAVEAAGRKLSKPVPIRSQKVVGECRT